MKTVFIGINGYDYPYVRVRCYHFAREVKKYGIESSVISFRDDFAPHLSGIDMLGIRDRKKLYLNFRAFLRLLKDSGAIFYIQKVHYHSAAPYFLTKLSGGSFVLDYDDWDIDRSPLFNRGYINRFFFGTDGVENVTKRVAEDAAACVASSHYLADYLSVWNRNVHYIPTGVDIEKFSRNTRRTGNEVNLIWTGNIWGEVMYENVMFLLRCFSKINPAGKKVTLCIAASGYFYDKLKSDSMKMRFPGAIQFYDWISPDKMNDLLNNMDIGLLPLIPDNDNDTWMRSKSPTKLFEYMAMELSTVSSDFGEVPHIIKNGENGFLGNSEDEFVEKINLLIKDDSLRVKMGEQAKKDVAENYSLDVLGEKLSKLLKTIKP